MKKHYNQITVSHKPVNYSIICNKKYFDHEHFIELKRTQQSRL